MSFVYGLKEHVNLGIGVTILTVLFAVIHNQLLPNANPITNGQIIVFLIGLGIIYWPMLAYLGFKPFITQHYDSTNGGKK